MFDWLFHPKESLEERQRKKEIEEMKKMYNETVDSVWRTWEVLYDVKRPDKDKKEDL